MNFHCRSLGTGVFLALWLFAELSAQAQNKVIRLRNEQIQTAPPNRELTFRAARQPAPPASGLFVIQFTGKFEPAWREELERHNVELLRYVPEDAFVARARQANLDDLRALPFVQWVGEYKVEHKLHGPLRNWMRGQVRPDDQRAVTILFSPSASAAELAEARARLQQVQHESRSRFGAVLRGRLAPGQLQRLAESPAVLWIEPAPNMKLNDEISSKIIAGPGSGHATFLQENGFDGNGVIVAVADSGLHIGQAAGMHDDLAGRTPAFFHYGEVDDASDEHAHGTHVAGIIAGDGSIGTVDEQGNLYGLGVAPRASIVTQRIFDGLGQYTLDDFGDTFEKLTRDAVQAGAVIGNNSWGDDTQGRYDVSAAEFDALVRDADATTPGDQPYILEFSAGNAGPGQQTIGSPAVAKNVIAAGASQNNRFDFFIYDDGSEAMADFSSRGPAEDGRIKPDVVAPGTWIASLRSPVGNDENAWLDIDADYLYMGGTSQAGPQVSGAAAVFVQYYRDTFGIGIPSPALVKAALIHSAVDMDDAFDTGPTPNMDEGWGRVDLTQIILNPRAHEYLDQTVLLAQNQMYERSVIIANTNEPLSITLVYTDVPGFPAAIPALVNDLDLEVIGPDGRVYRGNQFDQGESVPDATGFDNLNNVEVIYLDVPNPGEYILRVRARTVAGDARLDTPAIDQDFALVISGNIPPSETGVVLLDRPRYTAPGRMRVKLFDLDLAGVPSTTVRVRSATEPNGMVLTLFPFNPSGVFTGSVETARAPAVANNSRLEIAHGDWIRVDYFDQSEQVTNTASAVADLLPPVISAVSVTNEFGQMVVFWSTDEPANSVVRFGTNGILSRSVTNNLLRTAHRIELADLVPGLTYSYLVVSADAAGNVATNNGGAPLNFVAVSPASVLLVNAYIPSAGDSLIPLNAYLDPLDQTGVTYDVWNTSERGMPVFNNLRSYKIVMWRLNDSINRSSDSIPTAQQNAIQQYLNSGGGFFLSSMEILSRLLNQNSTGFITNVLRVSRFERNPNPFEHCLNCDEDFRVPTARGVTSDIIGDGLYLGMDYTAYPAIEFFELGPDFGDTFGPSTNAAPFLLEDGSGKACGLRYPRTGQDSTGRVIFVSFPLDAIPDTALAPNDRASLLRRAFQFLSPGLDGLGTIALSQASYRLPDQIVIEVGDSDLARLASTTVQVYSQSFSNRIAVTLSPTTRSGLFRGFVPLISGTNPPVAGRLRANHGDTLFAEYFDASGQITVQATARVDAVPPIISGLNTNPEYQNAVISWDTSEPTDALVQFGESTFLGRTAYVPDLGTSHEVQLSGLAPDRLYYFKIVSRDASGNATENDNGGRLHTFRTKRPITPPFEDNLQNGGTNWSVFSGEDSQFSWRLGNPNNGLVSSTPTGPGDAWASNLMGEPADYIDTFLISPAIDLSGGNVARLKFWHAHDFAEESGADVINGGALLIFTNSVTSPVTLKTYSDSNGGWREEAIDLTPYLGNVVFLVWYHQLFSIASVPRPGWAIDDISVTVSNIPPGVIEVTNNLAQGRVTLAGPVNRSGQGNWLRYTNLPPGRYVATWSPVPYYLTPSPKTNTLETDGLLELQGVYTFPDTNGNGISDTWEMQYFGTLNPARSCLTDADNDGFPDCAEFRAGTNPTNANSTLRLAAPAVFYVNNYPKLRFQWPTVSGRIYQLQHSRDGLEWTPLSFWLPATGSSLSSIHFAPDPFEPFLYRVEVRP